VDAAIFSIIKVEEVENHREVPRDQLEGTPLNAFIATYKIRRRILFAEGFKTRIINMFDFINKTLAGAGIWQGKRRTRAWIKFE
jgi:hypothetical protein